MLELSVRKALVGTMLAGVAACSSGAGESPTDGAWVGTITTEGDVTTVVNESGSVWGGPARLVEDLSIGVEEGEDPYLLGRVMSIWATGERIYVVDAQVPTVRVYDRNGAFVRDIGRAGQGPGEDASPVSVAVLPDGRVVVRSYDVGQRTNVYTPEGEYLDTWYGDPTFGTDVPAVVTFDGAYLGEARGVSERERAERVLGMAQLGPDGLTGELVRFPVIPAPERPERMWAGRTRFGVPFSPSVARAMLPSGATAAAATNGYRVVVERPDDGRLIIERSVDAVPITPEQREWERRRLVGSARRFDPSFEWAGDEIPARHQTLSSIIADRAHRIWVRRPVGIARVSGCTENPLVVEEASVIRCYETEYAADVFDEATGKLLGEVLLPPGMNPRVLFLGEDELYTTAEDEAGTIMVKRYRLILPEER